MYAIRNTNKGTEVGQKNTPAGLATGMLYTGRVMETQPVEINYGHSRSRRGNLIGGQRGLERR